MALCLGAVLVGLGGFITWGSMVPLAEGVTAVGQISLDEERKAIQHLEGGILRSIHFKEGQKVSKGDVLFEIDSLAITASRDQIVLERANALASIDRIEALMSDLEVVFSSRNDWGLDQDQQKNVQLQQKSLYDEQLSNQSARIQLLRQRRATMLSAMESQQIEVSTIADSIELISNEITLKQNLVDEKLARVEELQNLLRQRAQLISQQAGVESRLQDSQSRADELSQEILQADAEFRELQSRDILEAKRTVASADEQLKAIEDAVQRTLVLAPSDGEVLNLNFATVGGVVKAGEVMLEIVPTTKDYWVTLQVLPQDRETVFSGLDVNVRLSGFKSWKSPTLQGEVVSVSADLKRIPETGASYYEARVRVDSDELRTGQLGLVIPGMPVEAFVASGNSRTVLEYIFEPIVTHFSKGLSSG